MKTKEITCPKCKQTFLFDYSEKMKPPYPTRCTNCGQRFKFYLTGEVEEEKIPEFKELKPKEVKKSLPIIKEKIVKIEEKVIRPIKEEMKRVEEEFKLEQEEIVVERKAIDKPTIAGALLIIVFIFGIATSLLTSSFSSTIFEVEKRDATIHGEVIDEFGNPIEKVKITISGTGKSTLTNEQGAYFIYGVNEGNYEIIASKNGYITTIKKVTLKGGTNDIYFKLEKGDENENRRSDETTGIITADNLKLANTIWISIIIAFSIMALIAGIFAFQRKKFWICLIGSALGITSGGLILLGPILSVLAFFLILFSKREFRS